MFQGVNFITHQLQTQQIERGDNIDGIMFSDVGGYHPSDIEFAVAYDIDQRKVGLPMGEAIHRGTNCCYNILPAHTPIATDCIVKQGPELDGVAHHMKAASEDDKERFFLYNEVVPASVKGFADELKELGVDVLLNYLPVGSQKATEFWAEVCLASGVSFVNCIPVFIASDPVWASRFAKAGVTIIGDDMRSQLGASIISAALQELFLARGMSVQMHYQDNIGGNTDFLNMQDQTRLASKKISKENVIRKQNELAGVDTPENTIAAGPAKYFPSLGDNKRAHWLIRATGFGGAPVEFTAELSVQDSPNSAGVVIEAIRLAKVAAELGIVGPVVGPSACTQKTPPVDLFTSDAHNECKQLAKRIVPEGYVFNNETSQYTHPFCESGK